LIKLIFCEKVGGFKMIFMKLFPEEISQNLKFVKLFVAQEPF